MTRDAAGSFGILLIDKPAGPTSHDVVGWVRWALRERSVGHCGTLDPPASGLLVVCVGAATKLVDYLTGVDKRYWARFVLGRSTTTADAVGQTIASAPVPEGIEAEALACLRSLVGAHELPPPAVSAVRLDGRRAHARGRAGEQPELPPRPQTVRALELLGHARVGESLTIDATLGVTKGTYIRSLAEELGRRLALPAHLGSLRRLACGELRLDDAAIVTGLTVDELPAIEGRPPKWRIDAPAQGDAANDVPGDARERAAALLRARLSPPWTRLPFPVGHPQASAGPLLQRLVQGQRLRAEPDTLAELGLAELTDEASEPALRALVDRAAGHLIIVNLDHTRISPVRLVRFAGELLDH